MPPLSRHYFNALTPTESSLLTTASGASVVNALAACGPSGNGAWLPTAHPFFTRSGEEPKPGRSGWTSGQISEWLAATGPSHAVDGWGFLARSLSSLIAGDMHSARHFAYYAELRAALSILATSGIGVFGNWNCVVDAAGNLAEVRDPARDRNFGTHKMAWLALDQWGGLPASGTRIFSSFTVGRVSFGDAITAMFPGSSSYPLSNALIKVWGLDLRKLSSEHSARNKSSYQPHALHPMRNSAVEVLDFLQDFWDVLEPHPGDPFLNLDRYLLRRLIEQQDEAVFGNTLGRRARFKSKHGNLDPALQALFPTDFLTRDSGSTDPTLLRLADTMTSGTTPRAFEMVARASLLLRLAIALVQQAFTDAGISPGSDLGYWWQPYGEDRGFWGSTGTSASIYDLWNDISLALDDAENVRLGASPSFSRESWSGAQPNGLPRIFEAERVAIWSLCS